VTDREALFRAILANPDDDTLRLIYADALEEANDTSRAAFIRSQVELAHVPEYDPAWIRFQYIDREKLYGDLLREDLPVLPEGIEWSREPFRRGLPAAIHARDAATFVRHADELFSMAPIESLEVFALRLSELDAFAQCPWRNRLVRISVPNGLGGPTLNLLFGSTRYERLKELHIGAMLTTGATASSVVRSSAFRQLTVLSYRDDQRTTGTGAFDGATTKFVNELIQMSEPPQLQKLDLSENRLTEEPLVQLLAAPILSTVEDLDLSENNLGAEGIQAIAAARLPNLRNLRLSRTRPEESGVRTLCQTEFQSNIRSLSLGGNNLPSIVGAVLAESEAIANLRVLNLSENRLGNDGAKSLSTSPNVRNLVHLDLSENIIDDVGANALGDSEYLEGIIFLNLSGNNISSDAAIRLKQRYGERVQLSAN
jgi:uncharacterized protein (TIGR02996 family)